MKEIKEKTMKKLSLAFTLLIPCSLHAQQTVVQL